MPRKVTMRRRVESTARTQRLPAAPTSLEWPTYTWSFAPSVMSQLQPGRRPFVRAVWVANVREATACALQGCWGHELGISPMPYRYCSSAMRQDDALPPVAARAVQVELQV